MNVHARRSAPPWYVVLLATAAAAVIIFAITQLGAPAASSARTSIEDVTAENGVVQATVAASGVVEPGVDDTLNFGTSGTLRSVAVRVGQHVKKGQLIATLDPAPAQLTLAEAEASLAVAQSNLTTLEDGSSTGSSAGSIAAGSSGSAAAVNGAKTSAPRASSGSVAAKPTAAQIQQAQVQVDAAQATVNADQQALAETTLYAPATGVIASLAGYSIGQEIAGSSSAAAARTATSAASRGATSTAAGASGSSSGSGFAQLINDSTMTMTVALSENNISSVRVGQPASVAISALSGVELAGRVSSISPLGSDSSGVVTYNATITVTQSNPKVLPGMSATATIVTSQAKGVTLPNNAIIGSGNAATVDLLKHGKVTVEPVVVGLRGGSRSQIVSGLTSGQEVQIKITLPALGTTTTSTSNPALAGGLGRRGIRAGLRALLGGAAG